jgi:hypothetical protein
VLALPWCRSSAVVLQIRVELPDQSTDAFLGGALVVGERLELVDEPLRMHPAESVLTDHELPSVIADNYRILQKAM